MTPINAHARQAVIGRAGGSETLIQHKLPGRMFGDAPARFGCVHTNRKRPRTPTLQPPPPTPPISMRRVYMLTHALWMILPEHCSQYPW